MANETTKPGTEGGAGAPPETQGSKPTPENAELKAAKAELMKKEKALKEANAALAEANEKIAALESAPATGKKSEYKFTHDGKTFRFVNTGAFNLPGVGTLTPSDVVKSKELQARLVKMRFGHIKEVF